MTRPRSSYLFRQYQLRRVQKKCTPKLIEQTTQLVSVGISVSTICKKVKLSRQLFYLWRQKGKAYLRSGLPLHHEPYGAFVEAVEEAEADYEINIVFRSFTGRRYKPNWKRDRQLLIRANPADWGPTGMAYVGKPDLRFL